MKRVWVGLFAFTALVCSPIISFARGDQRITPQAGARTYEQNYKDMVLATCIADAYQKDKDAAIDAGSSVSALRDWTCYDLEKGPDAIKTLVDSYLARDYYNPIVESEMKGVRFDLLKCLDLYHSSELNAQAKRLVINPKRTHRQKSPLPAKTK